MSKFPEAWFINTNIKVEEYNDKEHYRKISCPECHVAPFHMRVQQNKDPYFAANRQEEHHEDCQHYDVPIKTDVLNKLVDSREPEDVERLKFLIDSNLNASLRLLRSTDKLLNENLKGRISNISRNQGNTGSTGSFKKESLHRVHIVNINKRPEIVNCHIVAYGRANLEVKIHEFEDKESKEKYLAKQLIFRTGKDFVFSIPLTRKQLFILKRRQKICQSFLQLLGF